METVSDSEEEVEQLVDALLGEQVCSFQRVAVHSSCHISRQTVFFSSVSRIQHSMYIYILSISAN